MTNGEGRESRDELLRLMKEYPELPVIPAVDGELTKGGDGLFIGTLVSARVEEYLIPQEYGESIVFKNLDNMLVDLENLLSEEEFNELIGHDGKYIYVPDYPEIMEKCKKVYDALPWVKAIVISIW